jgi:single-strand DNA-binding protein
MNKCVLIGRISSDIELRTTQSGIATCSFSVAINNGKDKDGNERPADFINCRAWRETANFISKWFQKGKMIAIEGKFKTNKYQHKSHSDVTMYSSYILIENVEFCGDKGGGQASQSASQTTAQNVVQQAQSVGVQTEQMNLSDFEEILSDGPVPF